MFRHLKVFIAFVVLLTTIGFGAVFAESDSSQGSLEQEGENEALMDDIIQQTQTFREKFGFDSDLQTIQDIANKDGVENKGVLRFGALLTDEEINEMNTRHKMGTKSRFVEEHLLENGFKDEYAGRYIGNRQGGKLMVGLKGVHDSIDKEKLNMVMDKLPDDTFPYKNRVEFYDAKFSQDELIEYTYDIWEKAGYLEENYDITLTASYDLFMDETIYFFVKEYLDEHREVFETYFPDLPLEIGEGEGFTQDTGVRGGSGIAPSGSADPQCSAGYPAVSQGKYYLVTAGHCVYDVGNYWWYNGSYIGYAPWGYVQNGGKVDAAGIEVYNNEQSRISDANTITYTGSLGWKLTHAQTTAEETIGDQVCKAGFASGMITCGELVTTSAKSSYAGTDGMYIELRGADYSRESGDSGGTVYYYDQLKGTHHGFDPGNSSIGVYSHVQNVESELGLTPVFFD